MLLSLQFAAGKMFWCSLRDENGSHCHTFYFFLVGLTFELEIELDFAVTKVWIKAHVQWLAL